jgi:hypothetical protein
VDLSVPFLGALTARSSIEMRSAQQHRVRLTQVREQRAGSCRLPCCALLRSAAYLRLLGPAPAKCWLRHAAPAPWGPADGQLLRAAAQLHQPPVAP